MIDTKNNPHSDNTTGSGEWGVIDDLQAMLANAARRHERGDSLSIEEVLRQGESLLSKVRSNYAQELAEQSVRDLIDTYWMQVAKRRDTAPTGFRTLNNILGGGFESKRLVVVLGAPNSGKTTFVHQMADYIADAGRPVLYVTSEDSPHDLMAKTLARIGNVNYTAVKKGWETERAKISAAIAQQLGRRSTDLLRYIDASNGITLDAVKAKAEAHFSRYRETGRGVFVVDYLQRIARAQKTLLGLNWDLRELVTMLTEQLRGIACELDCCVIAIASQNRASGYSAANSALASAKESGDIEYTADVILALGDDSSERKRDASSSMKPLILRIDKNRQGDKDKKISLDWQPDRQMFTEAAR